MKLKPLGDVAEVISGQSPEGIYYNSTGEGTPFYQGKKEFGEKFLGKPTTWTSKITKLAQSGDILMSVRAPVGPINFATQQICIGRGLAAIRPSEGIDRDYLYFFLLHKQSDIAGKTGAVFDSINKNQIESIEVPIPSPAQQTKIVEKLERAFAEIDLLEKNLDLCDEKSSQLLQSLLSSLISPAKEQNEFQKVFTVIPDSKSKIKSSSYLESGKYAVVDQGKELIAGYTNTSPTVDEKFLPVIVFGDHTRAVKFVDFPFTAGADGTQILKPSELTNPKYGFYLLLHAVGRIPSKGYARHFGELKKMQFELPSLDEQRQIVEKLDRAYAEMDLFKVQTKNEKVHIAALRQSLLSGAFTQDVAGA